MQKIKLITLNIIYIFSILLFYSINVSSMNHLSSPCTKMLPKLGHSGEKEPTPMQLQSGRGLGTITWSEITGGPRHIRGDITPPSEEDPEAIVFKFLEEKKDLYGIDDPQRDLYKIKSVVNKWTHYTTIHLGQRYKGIPVENTLVISVSPKGVITSIQGDYFPDIEVDINPRVSAEEAKAIAYEYELNCDTPFGPAGYWEESELVPLFYTPLDELLPTVEPELMIWPTASKDYLFWHFQLNYFGYYIDAHDAVIRGALNLWASSGFGSGPLSENPGEEDTITWPNIEVTPAALDFGEIEIKKDSSNKEVVISNKGEGALTITDISLSESPFTLKDFSPSFPLFIAPNEGLALNLGFSPTSLGEFDGAMVIISNDPHYPRVEIELKGKGIAPALNFWGSQSPFYSYMSYYTSWPILPLQYEGVTINNIQPQNYYSSGYNLSQYQKFSTYSGYLAKNYQSNSLYFPFTDFINQPMWKQEYRDYPYPWLLPTNNTF
jgi:hypothetical protein